MTAERSFAESWQLLGPIVELAMQIVVCDPAGLTTLLTTARLGIGTEGEQSLLAVLTGMRSAAEAQLDVARKAIERIETISRLANETALAAPSAGGAN